MIDTVNIYFISRLLYYGFIIRYTKGENDMKKLKKRIMSLALALTLALGCCAVVDTTTTQAATKNYMEKHNIKKGKVDKKYKVNTTIKYLKKKQTNYYYITDFEITDSYLYKGCKIASFDIIADLGKVDFSKISKKKLLEEQYWDICKFDLFLNVINIKTGKTACTDKGRDIVKINDDVDFSFTNFGNNEDYTFKYNGITFDIVNYDRCAAHVEITYSKSCKDLAIIYGMIDTAKYPSISADDKFWDTTGFSFSKTSYYKSKKTCRYIPLN